MFHRDRPSKHLDFSSKILPFASYFQLIFSVFGYPDETPSLVFDILHQTLATVFHRLSKHLEFRQTEYSLQIVFSILLSSVFGYPDETLSITPIELMNFKI